MTLELVQYDLTVPKVRYFLDLRYGILWGVGGDPNDTMRWKVSSEKLRMVEFASCFLETLDSSGTSLKDKF